MVVKWGIIGCGDVAEHKGGPALYNVEGSELVAVMRRDVKKAKDFAKRHGAKRYYGRVEDLLEDEEVNAVYISAPPYLHCRYTVQSAEAGKHILCEKPMALNVKECKTMIDACKRNHVKLMIAYYRRCYPNVQQVKKMLEQGIIGEPVLAKVSATGYYNPENPSDPKNWRTDPDVAGGGVLMDIGCHYIDSLLYILGDAAKVKGLVDTLHCRYRVEDSASLLLKFKSGVHGLANFNWNTKVGGVNLEVYGTDGMVSASPGDVLRSGDLTLYTQKDGLKEVRLEPLKITHFGIVKDFVASLAEDIAPICPGEEGMKTSIVIEAAYNNYNDALNY